MRIGIDLGGTRIELVVLAEDGQTLMRRRVATPTADYRATLATIGRLVQEVEQELGVTGTVGVGHPGAISPLTGVVKNANSTYLDGRPLDRDLADVLGREVRLANDADCLALSEAFDGAGAGARIVFGVILGTGVGGGLVVDRRLLVGPNATTGEWGHNPMPYPHLDGDGPGPACYCGRTGCIETHLSGRGLTRSYAESSGEEVPVPQIVARAEAGEPDAEEAMVAYGDRLARALSTVINIVDPHVIVLGGGLSNIDRLYREVPELWGRYVFSEFVATRLIKNHHGNSSGVLGAARLWDGADVEPDPGR